MMSTQSLEHGDLTEQIIGAAIEVHRRLGPGFLESFYENALVIELQKRGMKVSQQLEVLVRYDGVVIGTHRLDLLINDTIVVELKAIKDLEDVHFAVARAYLKAMGLKHGLIINFSKHPIQIKRVVFDPN